MTPRKESYRNFMHGRWHGNEFSLLNMVRSRSLEGHIRGHRSLSVSMSRPNISCQHGDRGKFHHVSPQPSKPNPFGLGIQTGNQFQQRNLQMQKTNPFGFGVQNNPQTSKQNKFKPFEKKWTCFSPINASNVSASRQPNNQSVASLHKCTNPESRKRKIIGDSEQERPLWKLTCATGTAKNNLFGQSNPFLSNSQTSGTFQTSISPFGTSGSVGNQFHKQTTSQIVFSSNYLDVQKIPFSTSAISSQISGSSSNLLPDPFTGPNSSPKGIALSMSNHLSSDTSERNAGDNNIWMKSKWSIGEIPEEEPPYIYCR